MRNILFILCLITASVKGQTDNTTWTFLNGRFLQVTNDLSDISSPSAARTNLSLGNVTNESKATMFTSPSLTGVPFISTATGTSLAVTGALTSSGTNGIGYTSGSGGTVTQLTSKATGVTINKIGGTITMMNSALAAAAEVKFTVTNSTVAATDLPMVAIKSGGTSGSYLIAVSAVAAGSFDVTISNASAGSLSEALVITFGVLKVSNN